jgi:hypothetical protein
MAFLQLGEPLPGLSHFSQALTMRRCGGLRHVAAFSCVPKKFLYFFHGAFNGLPRELRWNIV